MKALHKGALFVVISALGYGMMPIFALYAYKEGINVTTLLFLSLTIASIVLFSYVFIKKEKVSLNKKNIVSLFVVGGIFYTLASIFYFLSVKFIDVSLSALILYMFPLYVAIFSYFIEGEKFTKKVIISMGICFLGLLLMLKTSTKAIDIRGVLLAFGAGLTFASYIVSGNRATKNMPSLVASSFISAFSALGILIGGILTSTMSFNFGVKAWWSIIAIALFSTVLSIVFFVKGLKILGSTMTSVLSLMEPLFAAFLAAILFGERLTMLQIIGGVAMLTGAGLVVLSYGKNSEESST